MVGQYANVEHIRVGKDYPTTLSYFGSFSTRGIAKQPNQSFAELFDERLGLYAKCADISIKCENMTQDQVCEKIIDQMGQVLE